MKLGIDVATKDVQRLIVRLARLKETVTATDGGTYTEQPYFSQVHLDSSWTEAELDSWLYESCTGIEWVGCYPLSAAQQKAA